MSEQDSPEHDAPGLWTLLAEELTPIAPPAEARARLVASLQGSERLMPFAIEIAERFNTPLALVRAALARVDQPGEWIEGLVPDVQVMHVHATHTGAVMLARMPTGMRIPRHRHRRRELTFVLDGILVVDGRTEQRSGALLVMEPGTEHGLVVGGTDDCVVVFAAPPPATP